jgi:hypothetical protein
MCALQGVTATTDTQTSKQQDQLPSGVNLYPAIRVLCNVVQQQLQAKIPCSLQALTNMLVAGDRVQVRRRSRL